MQTETRLSTKKQAERKGYRMEYHIASQEQPDQCGEDMKGYRWEPESPVGEYRETPLEEA